MLARKQINRFILIIAGLLPVYFIVLSLNSYEILSDTSTITALRSANAIAVLELFGLFDTKRQVRTMLLVTILYGIQCLVSLVF